MTTDIRDLNSWIEISESAYAGNLKFFKDRLPAKTEFSVVVKSNAYGHGLPEIARLALRHGADSFCVHSLEEAMLLRNEGIDRDILIMGHVPLGRLKDAVNGKFRLVLYNPESLAELIRITKKNRTSVKVHLKLETGTYRQGVDEDLLPQMLATLKNNSQVKLDGVYTHFANIEDTTSHDYAFYQLDRYNKMVDRIRDAGFDGFKRHTACSAALLLFPETYFEMVRLGISQYGMWPSRETLVSYKMKHPGNDRDILRPVLSWKARISQVKEVPANRYIGYGCTYQTTRPSRIAILPVGYSDGYDRNLSNQSYVLIRGKRAPVRGRICMNLFMVDVTDIPEVNLEDEAVLIGRQDEEVITVEYLAGLGRTINYEFVTRLNWQIPRLVTP